MHRYKISELALVQVFESHHILTRLIMRLRQFKSLKLMFTALYLLKGLTWPMRQSREIFLSWAFV